MAIVVSLGLSAFGAQFADPVLDWLGLGDQAWLAPVITVVTLLIAMAADVLIFMWVYTMLPGKELRSPFKARLRGSIIAAVGFEILKYALIVLLPGRRDRRRRPRRSSARSSACCSSSTWSRSWCCSSRPGSPPRRAARSWTDEAAAGGAGGHR